MTGPDSLIAFVNARLDEDEAAARDAGGDQWTAQNGDVVSKALAEGDYGSRGYWVASASFACEGEWEALHEGHAEHIARHDPARVLRETEAKRRILTIHDADDFGCQLCDMGDGLQPGGWCSTVRALAASWSDHPDYRQEWKP